MQKTVFDRIGDDVVDTLAGIRVAGGYHFDATVEKRKSTSNTASGDGFLVVAYNDPEESPEQPISFDDYDLPFTIEYERARSENDVDKTIDQLHAETYGDIKKALRQDYTRGGLAIVTRNFASSVGDNGGDGRISGSVSFTVWVRTVKDDAFASAFES